MPNLLPQRYEKIKGRIIRQFQGVNHCHQCKGAPLDNNLYVEYVTHCVRNIKNKHDKELTDVQLLLKVLVAYNSRFGGSFKFSMEA